MTEIASPHYQTSFIANGVYFYINAPCKRNEMYVYNSWTCKTLELDDIVIYMPLN